MRCAVSSKFLLSILLLTCVSGRYILVPKAGVKVNHASAHVRSAKVMGIGMKQFVFTQKNLTKSERESLSKDYFIEEDKPVSIKWHLNRINQRSLPLDSSNSNAFVDRNVDIYVIDTGVDILHPEFDGRASWGANFAGDNVNTDCHGHGTHVASLAAGKVHGVAKGANIIGVKVLGCNGSGYTSSIISAIEWVTTRYISTKRHTVINLSLGGSSSSAMQSAIAASFNAGVFFVAAAGNSNIDACLTSPANALQAITVAASDKYDTKASFSNYGPCVDTYAPGVSVTGAWPGNRYAVLSGTSMASPVAAGTLAVYLSRWGRSGYTYFHDQMTYFVVKNNPAKTQNKLVYLSDSRVCY